MSEAAKRTGVGEHGMDEAPPPSAARMSAARIDGDRPDG
jgi:hypothetical protein